MTPAEVGDVVFGAYTRDVPMPITMMSTPLPWAMLYRTAKPEWYVDPVPQLIPTTAWGWGAVAFG